jgi:hypothetical protein
MYRLSILNFSTTTLLLLIGAATLSQLATFAYSTPLDDKTYGLPYNSVQFIPNPQSPNMQGQLPSVDLMPYENPQLGIRVLIPSDSQIMEEYPGGINFVVPNLRLGINLIAEPSNGETLEQEISRFTSDSSFVSTGESMLSNNRASYVILNSQEIGYNIVTVTLYNDKFYGLQFTMDPLNFQSLSPLLLQIHSSYQIIS